MASIKQSSDTQQSTEVENDATQRSLDNEGPQPVKQRSEREKQHVDQLKSREEVKKSQKSEEEMKTNENKTIDPQVTLSSECSHHHKKRKRVVLRDPLHLLNLQKPKDESRQYLLNKTVVINLIYFFMNCKQLYFLGHCAAFFGGLWFVSAYFILNFLAILPLFEHFIFIAKTTKAGCTKVVEMFNPFFRSFGHVLMFIVLLSHVQTVLRTAEMTSFFTSLGDDPLVALRCPGDDTCESHRLEENIQCCYSILDYRSCIETYEQKKDKEEFCSNPFNNYTLYSSSVVTFNKNLDMENKESSFTTIIIHSMLILVIPTVLASFGINVLSVTQVVLFPITLLILTIILLLTIIYGNFTEGLKFVISNSSFDRFLTLESFVYLSFMLYPFKAAEFNIISMACYLPKTSDSKKIANRIVVFHAILELFLFIMDASIRGSLVKLPVPTSLSVANYDESCDVFRTIILEFYASSDVSWMFQLYVAVGVLMSMGHILGSYFSILSMLKDEYQQTTILKTTLKRVGYNTVFAILTLSLIALRAFDKTEYSLYMIVLTMIQSLLIPIVVALTLYLYGRSQDEIDKEELTNNNKFPPPETHEEKEEENKKKYVFLKSFLEMLVSVYHWIQTYLSNLTFACTFLSLIVFVTMFYSISKYFDHSIRPVMVLAHVFPFVLLVFIFTFTFCLDVAKFKLFPIPFWRLIGPSIHHPSYRRMLWRHGLVNSFKSTTKRKRKEKQTRLETQVKETK